VFSCARDPYESTGCWPWCNAGVFTAPGTVAQTVRIVTHRGPGDAVAQGAPWTEARVDQRTRLALKERRVA